MTKWVLGMDIGGTNIRMGKVDEQYKLYDFIKTDSKEILTGEQSVDNLTKLIKNYIEKYHKDSNPSAIAIGFPATVDKEKKYVVNGPNVKGLDGVNIVDTFEKEFNIPIFLEKDVNMIVSYDLYQLGIKSEGIIIGCYVGTGFGNALVINNEIYSGFSGAAGELGHIPVPGKTDLCGCGNEGCIELYSGGKQLEIIGEKYFPKTLIREIFLKHGDQEIVQDYVEAMSLPIAAEINILDPEFVIMGGGVIQMKGFDLELLEKNIRKHTRKPYPNDTLQILYPTQNQENGVLGAGVYAFNKLN